MISFSTVTKAFGDEIFALRDVSFQIDPGELVVITGPSGSGKTTIMRLLTKEYDPTEGEIIFDDVPLSQVKHSKVHELRRKMGVVFQDYKLLPELNVWENIALSLNITGQKQAEIEERVSDLLRLISLDDKPYLFPSQLSGGEAQRVSIARALATAPKVIFADEPTGNLDAETSASIARLLQKINELGTTVLIATHDISVLDLLQNERHIHLEKGKLMSDEKGSSTAHSKSKITAPAKISSTDSNEIKPTIESERPWEGAEAKAAAPVETQVESLDDTQPVADEPLPRKKFKLPSFWPFGRKPKSVPEIVEPTEKTPETKIETRVESLEEPTSQKTTETAGAPKPNIENPKPTKIKIHHPKSVAKPKTDGDTP